MIPDDTIGAAKAAWLGGDADRAQSILTQAFQGGVLASLPAAQRRGQLTRPPHQWNHLVSLLIQLGEWTRAAELISAQFDISKVALEREPTMPGERVWLELGRETVKLTIRPESTTKLYWTVCLRLVEMLPLIAHIARTASQTVFCALSLADVGFDAELSFSTADPMGVRVPDPYFISRDAYGAERTAFHNTAIPWAERSSRVFWRGATTGERHPDWRSLQRIKLCEIANGDAAGRFDCGVNAVVQAISPLEAEEISAAGLIRSFVPPTTFNQYKYHIDIDGNTNSWPGFFIKLLSGGAVFKVQSAQGYEQWYYSRLKPWEHYIPVESDLSDLLEKVAWLDGHEPEAMAIGEAGRGLALSLTLDSEVPATTARIEEAFREGLIS